MHVQIHAGFTSTTVEAVLLHAVLCFLFCPTVARTSRSELLLKHLHGTQACNFCRAAAQELQGRCASSGHVFKSCLLHIGSSKHRPGTHCYPRHDSQHYCSPGSPCTHRLSPSMAHSPCTALPDPQRRMLEGVLAARTMRAMHLTEWAAVLSSLEHICLGLLICSYELMARCTRKARR